MTVTELWVSRTMDRIGHAMGAWIGPQRLYGSGEFAVIKATNDSKRSIDVLVSLNLIEASSRDCHLRVPFTSFHHPSIAWFRPFEYIACIPALNTDDDAAAQRER